MSRTEEQPGRMVFRCRNCGGNPPRTWGDDRRCPERRGEHYLRASCEYQALSLDPEHALVQINGVLADLRVGIQDDAHRIELIEALEVATADLQVVSPDTEPTP